MVFINDVKKRRSIICYKPDLVPEDMLNQIFAPGMKMLASSRRSGEEVEVIDTDPKDADSQRITKYNDLWADRRKELYRFLLN